MGPLILVQKGHLPRGVRRIEMFALDYSLDLQKTVASYDRDSCAKALEAAIFLYQSLRKSGGTLKRNDEAEKLAIGYLKKVSDHN